MHDLRRDIDWEVMRRTSRLIKSSEFDLEMLGVVAEICDFSYRGWYGKFRLIIRRLFFVGIPQEFKSKRYRNNEPVVTLLSSICRDDYVAMINGLEKRLEVGYSCNISCGTKWEFSNFLCGWVEAYRKCNKYSLISSKNSLARNIISLIFTAHAIKSKCKLKGLIRREYNDQSLIVFLNAANSLESIWCSAFDTLGYRKTICLQHAHYFEFHKDNIPFDNINYFNIAARNFIGWTRQVGSLLSELNVNLDIYVGGEIVKSNSADILSAFNFNTQKLIVVFLARDFHLTQNISLLKELRDAGICKISICLHPSSSKKLYESIPGLVLEFISKDDEMVQQSIVFVSSTSVYFDLLKKGIFTVLFVTSQSEFNGLIEVRDSTDIKNVLNDLEAKRFELLDKSSDFLKSATGYLYDDYLSIFDKLS